MQEEKIEQHIRNAIDSITPNVLEKVNSVSLEELKEFDLPCENKRIMRDKKYKLIYSMAVVCAACFVAVLGINMANGKVATTIDIDVNPSIQITADKSDHVIDVIPLNSEGEIIIDNMNMQKVDLDVAVNAIIGSMVKNGYLTEAKNAILISVDNKDKTKAEQIRNFLTEDISVWLSESNIKATIYNQEVSKDKSLQDISEKYGISIGKASFLDKLIERSGYLTYEDLVPLSMEEITDLIMRENISLQGIIEYEEDESLRENIEDALEDAEEDNNLENKDKKLEDKNKRLDLEESDDDDDDYNDNDNDDDLEDSEEED